MNDYSSSRPSQHPSYHPVRPLPTPHSSGGPTPASASSSSISLSSAASRSTHPSTPSPSVSTAEDRTRRASGLLDGMRGSYRTSHGKESSSGSSLVSPVGQPPRGHSPLPPVPRPPPTSHTSTPSVPSVSPTSPYSHAHRTPLAPGTFCTATADHESLSVVTLTGLSSVAAIKERILSKLHIGDDEFFRCSFFLTRIGAGEGRHIDDEELWDVCARSADGAAVTIFVKQLPSGAGGMSGADFSGGTSAQNMRHSSGGHGEQRGSAFKSGPAGARSPTSDTPPPNAVKSPSISSHSDSSHHQVETDGHPYSPGGGLRSDRPSWVRGQPPRAGEGHRASGSYGSGGGGLSPPVDRSRDRAGSTTPTPPDEYAWDREESRRDEPARRQLPPPLQLAPGYSSQEPQQVAMGQSGPIRRLPPQSQGSQDDGRRSASGSALPLQMPQASVPGWGRSVPAPQLVRPLPPADPRANHPQYQYTTVPPSSSQYHNLSLQAQYQTQGPPGGSSSQYGQHSPNPQHTSTFAGPPPSHRVQMSKSVDNLRGHYAQAFDHDIRPPPVPGPIPPQYMSNRPPAQQGGYPGSLGSRAPPPPSNYPHQLHSRPSQPSFPPPPSQPYPPFDPRIMRPPQAQYRPSPPPSAPYFPGPPLPQRPHLANPPSHGPSSPLNNQAWAPPLPPRRSTKELVHERPYETFSGRPSSQEQPARLPDLSGALHLHPGETLQSVRARRSSEGHSESHSRPPTAAYMRGDPSHERKQRPPTTPLPNAYEGFETAWYGSESVPRRESSGSMSERQVSADKSRRTSDGLPVSHQSGTPGEVTSPRDSGSSFASSSLWKPMLVASAPPGEGAYGGMEDDYPAYTSPPSSARSSTSASGPLTPSTDQINTVPLVSPLPSSATYPDGFGDPVEEEGGTWFPINQPKSPPLVGMPTPPTPTDPVARPSEKLLAHENDGESGTVRAHEWADSLLKSFPQDGEGTIMTREKTTLGPTSTAPATSPLVDTTPKVAFVEDPTFYRLEDKNAPFPLTNEFDDDVEDSATFFNPPKLVVPPLIKPDLASPTSPVGVSLYDEPSSRSPTTDRQHKDKRPTLTLQIEPPSEPQSPQLAADSSSPPPRKSAGPSSAGSNPLASTSRRTDRIRSSAGTIRLSELSELGGPILRRASFATHGQGWASRPAVETVLEHLEDFFPEHDLDKPIVDAAVTLLTSTSSTGTSPARDSGAQVPTRRGGATGLGYKKSIRKVAQDQKRTLMRASANSQKDSKTSVGSSLMRRKSTKLFGTRVEEVTSAQMKRMDNTILESPRDDDPANFSFKWIKGEEIGRGTYGRVFLAYNITAAEFIAVKQVELPKTRSDKEDLRQQGMVASLKAEIELLKDLEHPRIVEYLGMEETIEHLSIFLEYVPGGSVGHIVRKNGKFEENIIKFFTYQILEGLEYLHSLGILHRDLKADNILCDHQGRCKISDFGTSKRSNDIYNNDANMSMQGSIFWMAPEVIHNFKQGYSAKADIWSLGCVCLEMFAGRRPWSDDEAIQAMFKLGAERLAPPIPDDVVLSKAASHFLSNCLSIDAELRPRASQLMRHSFLTLPDDWSFMDTSLFAAIAPVPEPAAAP